jgi:mannose/fructose/N-acetylgalactosamine-specific phosphotransferase system component IID
MDGGHVSGVKSTDLMRVASRLSLLQTTWFEGGMQSIGLAYCLIPGLRSLYPKPDDLQEALDRYQTPFNTHPFLAGIIAGALLKMEEQHAPPKDIAYFSTNTMGVLAAFGDPFFRSALPMFATVCACLAAMLGGVIAGIATLLVLFNAVHFAVRFGGINLGFREGRDVVPSVARWLSPKRTHMIRRLSAIGIGLVLVGTAMTFGAMTPGSRWPTLAACATAVLASVSMTLWRPTQQLAIPVALAVVVLIEVSI